MRFDYLQSKTVEQAINSLIKYNGNARVIAGGTDLVVQMRKKLVAPQALVDIGEVSGLSYISYDGKKGLKIGALTTIRALEKSTLLQKMYPVIPQAASQLGSVAIRNVATIGGNLCNASPSAETAPALIGLSASAKIVGPEGERMIPIEEFFTGPGNTVLKRGELLVEVNVPVLPSNTKGVYLKHGIRGSIDLAIVGVAAIITLDGEVCKDIKLVLGAVAPTPMRARRAEELIKGKKIEEDLVNQVAKVASEEARPISDVRATAEYRKEMVKVFTRRAIREVIGSIA